MAPISERRQRNSNNWKHRPGTSKSVAMRIAYDWFFDTRIDSSGPTISNSIGWRFLCGQCQASPYIPSMPASITYWRDRLKLKLILMARLQELQSPSGPAQGFGHVSGRRLKRRLLNRYCIIRRSESVTQHAKKTHMDTLASSKACNGPCNACNYVHYLLLVMAT